MRPSVSSGYFAFRYRSQLRDGSIKDSLRRHVAQVSDDLPAFVDKIREGFARVVDLSGEHFTRGLALTQPRNGRVVLLETVVQELRGAALNVARCLAPCPVRYFRVAQRFRVDPPQGSHIERRWNQFALLCHIALLQRSGTASLRERWTETTRHAPNPD